MLVNWQDPKHVYIVCGKTDLRKGIDGLAIVVQENYGLGLFDDSLFLFCGNRNDRFKGLYWDGEGFILLYKRFENGGLRWPRYRNDAHQLSNKLGNYWKVSIRYLRDGLNPRHMGLFIKFLAVNGPLFSV